MNYLGKLFLLLFLSQQTFLEAIDNEIVIRGTVLDGVTIDKILLSKNMTDIYLSSNSKMGARVLVRDLKYDNVVKNKSILNNGREQPLPLIYNLFNTPSFLGMSPLCSENVVLAIDISAH